MTAELRLRSYQQEAIDAVFKAWSDACDRPAIVMPTGSGKTPTFTGLISRFWKQTGQRALVLAHREELISQAQDKIRQFAPSLTTGRVKAEDDDVHAQVVVASIQTLSRPARLQRLLDSQAEHGSIGLVIVDETHHAAAQSYRTVIDAFPEAKFCGVTATLSRSDGGLGDVIDDVVFSRSVLWMISKGYLVNPRSVAVRLDNLDLRGLKKVGGDYEASKLGAALEEAELPERLPGILKQFAPERRTIVFTPTVATAEKTAASLNAAGVRAGSVSGATPREDRRKLYEDFRTGAVQVLVNCMVLTEGFDAPWTNCVVMARPTQSPVLYQQCVGRGLRTWDGKTDALVLDVVGASEDHRLRTLIDLAEADIRPRSIKDGETLAEAVAREAEEAGTPVPASHPAFQILHRDVDLFAASSSVWLRTHGGVQFIPSGDWNTFLWPHGDGTWDVCKAPRRGKWERLHTGLDLSAAMAWGEAEAEELGGTIARRTASWRKRKQPPSEAQLAMARRLRIEVPEDARKDQVSDLISIAFASQLFDRFMKIA